MTTSVDPVEHEPTCPRAQFWDAGELEAPCTCDVEREPLSFDEFLEDFIGRVIAHGRHVDEQVWARAAWNARQPEVDALKMERARYRAALEAQISRASWRE